MERLTIRDGNEIYFNCGEKVDITEKEMKHMMLKRLARYEDAEEQGRTVSLPCCVGDMVYYRKGMFIYGDDVKCIVLDGLDNQVIVDGNHCYMFSDFGVNVFLSREEAEKALEGKT